MSLPGAIEQVVIVRNEQDSQVVARDVPDLQVVRTDAEGSSIVITALEQSIVARDAQDLQVVVLETQDQQVLFAGEQGPQGVQGIPGPVGSSALQYPAGAALGGHRMAVLNDAGQAIYADKDIPAHAGKVLGMTTGAVALGDLATIQTGGELTEPSWAWTLDTPVWLGSNGLLTQATPTTGFSLIVGFPITATKLFINLREPIFLN